MADIKLKAYPDGTGNWSDGSIWIGGVVPGAGDVAFINGDDNVVTLDGDVTVQYVTRDSGYGAVDFAGYTMTTTSGSGGGAWNKPRIRNSVPGGRLLITCATDGEWFVFVYYTLDSGGTLSNPFEIAPATDDGNHRINLVQLHAAQSGHIKGLRIHGCKGRTFYASYGYDLLLEDCDFYDGDYVHFAHCSSIILAGEVYVHGQNHADYGVRLTQCGMVSGHGLICGKNIDGTAHGNIGTDIKGDYSRVNLKNSVVDTAKVELLDISLYGQYSIHLAGLGYAGSSHLCNDVNTPWDDRLWWAGVGTCQKISSSDPTRRITPNSDVSTTKPFRLQLPPIPASGGEQISLELVAQAGVAAHECSLVLDPDNLYGAYAIQTKDCETAETTFSVTVTPAVGHCDVAIPAEFRVREYHAGGYANIEGVKVALNSEREFTLDLQRWRWIETDYTVTVRTTSDLSGLVDSATANTLTDNSASFPTAGDGLAGVLVHIIEGYAAGEVGVIASNTGTALTLESNWGKTPLAGDRYAIGAIPFRFATGWRDFGDPDAMKRVRSATVVMNNDNSIVADLTLELYADLDDTTPLSTASVDLREDRVKVALPGYGRHFKLVGYNNDVDVPIKILKIVLDVVFPEN